jgi:Ca-activated chloride channel homolog
MRTARPATCSTVLMFLGAALVGACTSDRAPSSEAQATDAQGDRPAKVTEARDPAAAIEDEAAAGDGVAKRKAANAPASPQPLAANEEVAQEGKGIAGGGAPRAQGGMGVGQGYGSGRREVGSLGPAARKPSTKRGSPGDSSPAELGFDPAAPAPPTQPPRAAEPDPLVEQAIDPNGRFATTYRPGGGHLAAFESAVARGLLPAGEREIVSDLGARYPLTIDAPTEGALGFAAHFERAKLQPSGGKLHLRLGLRSSSKPATERPRLSVALVLDVSGSMRGELIQSARKAAIDLVDKLAPTDDFSLVTFSSGAQTVVPMGAIGPRRDQVKATIAAIQEGGGTNIGEGLRLGYAELSKPQLEDNVRVTLLLSDGRANDGITDRGRLAGLALEAFQSGIQTSALGLGTDYDGPLMSQIANDGAGGYYYLRDPQQIAPALATELDKRLDPVATAVEVRLRVKPGIEVLNVYGSRRLSEVEAQRVRAIEVASDKQTEKRDGIKANRQEDVEGGMRFLIPAFARDDSHAILLELRLPAGIGPKDVALVELKYKDRLTKKNVAEEIPLRLEYANSDAESAKTIDPSVARTVQGFAAGEALMKASRLVALGRNREAIDLLGEREGLLHHAASTLGEPLFVQDAQRLARLRTHALGGGAFGDALVLAMVMETAGNVHLR